MERAERFGRGLEQAKDVRFDRHVGLHGDGATAAANDLADHRVSRIALPVIVHAHGVAARAGHPRGGGADASTAARHDDRAGAARAAHGLPPEASSANPKTRPPPVPDSTATNCLPSSS